MTHHEDGIIDADKAYTDKALMRIFGRKDDQFIRDLVEAGVPHRPIGRSRVFAGVSILRWIEQGETLDEIEIEPPKPKGRK